MGLPLILLSALLILLAPLAGGCGGGSPVRERAVVMAVESNPTSLDPRFALDAVSSHIVRLIFNRLLRRNARGEVEPELADEWRQPDPLTYLFRLRAGVRFHDGAPLTAKDVKFTFDSLRDPQLGSPKAGSYRELERVEAPGPRTVVFRLREPSAPFLEALQADIVPRHLAEPAGRAFGERPVGSGPFRFVRFEAGERVVLAANSDYVEGKPPIERLIFRVVPDATVRVLELESGGVHLLQNSFTPDLLPRLLANPRLRVQRAEGTNFSYIGFNLEDPILGHRKVRQAIAHAIDRAPIIRHILKGLGRPADSLLPEGHWAHAEGLPRYPHDPARARRLLEEAGYPDPDGPGPRPRFRLLFKTSQDELRRRIASVFAEQLRQVGVELRIRSYEWGTFFGDIRRGNFQLYSLTWVGIRDPDIYRYIFHSRSVPPEGANRNRYRNPLVDRLLDEGRRTLSRLERRRIYGEVQRILAHDLPYIHLWHSTNVAAMDRRLVGFILYPDEDLISLKGARFEGASGRAGNPRRPAAWGPRAGAGG
ncbi:MAG: ABC transporter substrate-binding protein [Nitrospinota bacterium]